MMSTKMPQSDGRRQPAINPLLPARYQPRDHFRSR
jgi:hypothetical protein